MARSQAGHTFNWTLVLGRGVVTGQLRSHLVCGVHLESLAGDLKLQGRKQCWGVAGMSLSGDALVVDLQFGESKELSVGSMGLIAADFGHIAPQNS